MEKTPWPSISDDAKAFVRGLLTIDPEARPTAAQALSHPWLRKRGGEEAVPLDHTVIESLKHFAQFSKLKRVSLLALASTQLSLESSSGTSGAREEVASLADQFAALDKNKDGRLDLDELAAGIEGSGSVAMGEANPPSHEALLEMIKAIDSNVDGSVDFTEFVAAALHLNQLIHGDAAAFDESAHKAFAALDRDGSGYIEVKELALALGDDAEAVAEALREADRDKDGRISFSEFKLLLSPSPSPRE